MHSFVFWAHKITTTTHITPNFHYLFTPASPQLQWTTWGKHWVTRSLVQCIFIQPMSLCLKETFNEFFELWPQIISSSILLVITKSGLILTFFSTGAKTGSEKRDIKGKGTLIQCYTTSYFHMSIRQDARPGTGGVGSLFPHKKVFQAQHPFFSGWAGVVRPHMWDCLSQQIKRKWSTDSYSSMDEYQKLSEINQDTKDSTSHDSIYRKL